VVYSTMSCFMTYVCIVTAPVFGTLRGCVVPCIRSMLSKVVDKEKQGRQLYFFARCIALDHCVSNAIIGMLFSGIGVVEATCTLVASVLYNSIYPLTREIYPGLCFFIMAIGLSLPFLLTM
jgi:hypothetical protein